MRKFDKIYFILIIVMMKMLLINSLRSINPWSTSSPSICDYRMSECRFYLRSTSLMTMFYKNLFRIVSNDQRILSKYDNSSEIYSPDQIVTADGYTKLVNLFNESLPGPTLQMFKGQKIFIEIENDLPLESLTIHFHGIRQWESVDNDGVPFLTQRSILPGEKFIYEFIVFDEGTFWYHSHVQSQTAMGLFGALIVHPNQIQQNPIEEFVLMINDWQHFYTSIELEHLVESGQFYPNDIESLMESNSIDYYENIDGSRSAESLVTSILINGRSSFIDPRRNESSTIPYEELIFPSMNSSYRIRLINSGSTFPIQISIDEFQMEILSSDGIHFNRTIFVDYLIVGLGERFDFLLHPNQIQSNRTSWWIRVKTMDRHNNPRWYSRSIFRLDSSSMNSIEPESEERICSNSEPCRIFNCPFDHYGAKSDDKICYSLKDVQSDENLLDENLIREDFRVDHQLYLSLIGVDSNGEESGFESMNSIGMIYPSISKEKPLIYQSEKARQMNICSNETNADEGQRCYHHLLVQLNETIELILVNYDNDQHPLHLHGHYFHLIEQRFSILNQTTGLKQSTNPRIQCDQSLHNCQCQSCQINAKIIKDTIIVPSGGYMRIRFRATNPGIWLFHCHTETHLSRGMSMTIHVGEKQLKDLLDKRYPKPVPSRSTTNFFSFSFSFVVFLLLFILILF